MGSGPRQSGRLLWVLLLLASPVGASDRLPIFMYHKVADHAPTQLWVTTQTLRTQLSLLSDYGYETVTFRDIVAFANGTQELPEKPVILTFDDGYENFYTHAWPALHEVGFVATSFVITRFVGRQNRWDWEVEPPTWHLNWMQIVELDRAGMEIAAHTVSHPHLSAIDSHKRFLELSGSRTTLEYFLGHSIVAFSYPYGDYSESVREQVIEARFSAAVTTVSGVNNLNRLDMFELKRINVYRDMTLPEFAAYLEPNGQAFEDRSASTIQRDPCVQKASHKRTFRGDSP